MSNRRSHLILVGLILAALAGVALLAFPGSPAHKKVTLGLDLQGGLEVVLKAVPPPGKTCDSACMDRSVSIMRTRIDKLGVSEPEIRKQGSDQIVIQLAGVHDPNKAAQIIGTTAQLQFYDLEKDVFGPSSDGAGNVVADASLYDLLTKVKADTKAGGSQYYLFNAKKKPVAGPEATRERLLGSTLPGGRKLNGTVPDGFTVLAVPKKAIVISCDQTTGCPGVQQVDATAPTVYYLFKYDPPAIPEATGEDLKLSDIAADISTQGQGNVVRLGFTGKGDTKFHDITRAEAQRGAALAAAAGQTGSDQATVQQFAQHFAIVLDGQLQSTPFIDYKQNPDGIDPTGTGAEISNIASIGEAKDLALVLQTGALPVQFHQIERTDVSATLGKDSLKQAKLAALIGLLIVAVFLLALYRFLGAPAARTEPGQGRARPIAVPARGPHPAGPLGHVDRNADCRRLVGDRPAHRLPDPPGRVGGEFDAAAPVELLDGAHQTNVALLDQVAEHQAAIAISLGDMHDEAQVRARQGVGGPSCVALALAQIAQNAAQLGDR